MYSNRTVAKHDYKTIKQLRMCRSDDKIFMCESSYCFNTS